MVICPACGVALAAFGGRERVAHMHRSACPGILRPDGGVA